MEKIKNLAPLLTLLVFLGKTIMIPASIPDALILFSLVAFVAIDSFRLKDKKIEEFNKKLAEFEETQAQFRQKVEKAENSVNSIRVGMGVRSANK